MKTTLGAWPNLGKLLFWVIFAAGISTTAQAEVEEMEEDNNGGFALLGPAINVFQNHIYDDAGLALGLSLNARYEWHGLFVELDSDKVAVPGFAMGYNLWDNENWSVDFMSTPSLEGFDPKDIDRLENTNLRKREAFSQWGLRVTHFDNDIVYQMHLLPISSKGWVGTLTGAKLWQVKNWNFVATLGLRYQSDDYNNYFYGVAQNETSPGFEFYEAGDGLNVTADFGVEYPLSERWVLDMGARFTWYSDEIGDSPITTRRYLAGIRTSVSYVF